MRYFSTLLFLIALFACTTPPARQNNEIIKIELARSGAWSDQGASISIDSSLNYYYYGLINESGLSAKRKYYAGKISQGFWDTLNRKLEKLHFKNQSSADNEFIADASYFELILYGKAGKKRLYSTQKDSVINVLDWLDNSYKKIALKQIDTPVHFETTLQKPPPIPHISQVKFPPPIHRGKRHAN